MGPKKVVWTRKSEIQLFVIMDYYAERNKSKTYSLKLKKAIDLKLINIDFSISLPQKTANETVFYFVHNHISVFFTFENNTIFVLLVWDERRNPAELFERLQHL